MLVACLVDMVKSAPTAFGFFLISAPPFAALVDLSTFNQGGQSLSNIIMMGIGRHPHTTCGTLLVSNAAMMSGFFLFISTTYLPTFNLGGSSKNIIMMDTTLIFFPQYIVGWFLYCQLHHLRPWPTSQLSTEEVIARVTSV